MNQWQAIYKRVANNMRTIKKREDMESDSMPS